MSKPVKPEANDAAEYVLGLLGAEEARAFAQRLKSDEALRAQVERTSMQAEVIALRAEKRQLKARLNTLLARDADAPLAEPDGFAPLPADTVFRRSALEAREFKWLGASDRVHFDYKGSSAPPRSATDVLAFQKLWNRNHPTDKLSEDGRYSPATEQRLKQAPPDGFAIGPTCSGRRAPSR